MLTSAQPRTLTRVPASLMAGKRLTERLDLLCAIARPFAEILAEPMTWQLENGEFRLETIPTPGEEA